MDNVFGVTEHLRKKLSAAGADPERGTLRFIPCRDGSRFYDGGAAGAWRVYRYIDRVVSLEAADTPETLEKVGFAFGSFSMMLSDYDASALCETIPHFHDTESRYNDFSESVNKDPMRRAANCGDEIAFVRERKNLCSYIVRGIEDGLFPLRVTHNDTKLNNILLDDKTLEPVCVIDLDTVMPGLAPYDFGDLVRVAANPGREDSGGCHLEARRDMYEACAEGFLEGFSGYLTEQEIRLMPVAGAVITFELAVRFLSDYLDGDRYFKTARPSHNLDRARTQIALARALERLAG